MKRQITFLVTALTILFSTMAIADKRGIKLKDVENNEGRRWAILIGINDYDDKGILDLKKAKNDAVALGQVLEKQGQFDKVYVLTDENDHKGNDYPSYFKIKDRLEYLSKFLKPEDLVVFSFSGHGVTIDGKSHLVVTDSRVKNMKETTINLEEDVIAMLNKAGVKKSLLLIDACRENFQENKGINKDGLRAKKFEKAEVAATFYATKAGWYSYEDNKSDYGAFTRHVVEGLKGHADREQGNKDGIVSFRELSTYVEEGVFEWAIENDKEQTPYTKIYGESYGDLALSLSDLEEKKNEDTLEEKTAEEVIEFVAVNNSAENIVVIEESKIKNNNIKPDKKLAMTSMNTTKQNNILSKAEKAFNAQKYLMAFNLLENSSKNIKNPSKKALYIYGKSAYEVGAKTGKTAYYVKTRDALSKFMRAEDKSSQNFSEARKVYNKIETILKDEDRLYKAAINIGGIDRYLRKYPNGRYAEELKQRRVALLKSTETIKKVNTTNNNNIRPNNVRPNPRDKRSNSTTNSKTTNNTYFDNNSNNNDNSTIRRDVPERKPGTGAKRPPSRKNK